jgi:hypothetical protein
MDMTDGSRQPRRNEEGDRRARDREERLAKALRDNLARRKAQQRARDAGIPPEPIGDDAADSFEG